MGKNRYEAGKILLEVSSVVNSSLDPEVVSKLVLNESRRALSCDHASLFVLDDRSGRFILAAADGFSDDEVDNIKLLESWEIINDHLIKHKRPLIVDDVHNDDIFKGGKLLLSDKRFPIESFLAVPLITSGRAIGALMVSNKERPGHAFTEDDRDLLLALSNNIAMAVQNAKLYQRMKNLFISTITSLTRAIDAKDSYTSGHSERVMRYSVAIGEEMGMGDEELENLKLASLLHDIGKIGIRESILMKPAKLLGYERREIRLHPHIGARIVESIDDSQFIRRGILEHHERFDGNGYPNRLKGELISLEGRIIAVADVFDASTTDRPYQKGGDRDMVFRKIEEASSSQFDPRVVAAFSASYKKRPEIWNPPQNSSIQ